MIWVTFYLTSAFGLNDRRSNYQIYLPLCFAYVRVRYDLGPLDRDIFTVIQFLIKG